MEGRQRKGRKKWRRKREREGAGCERNNGVRLSGVR